MADNQSQEQDPRRRLAQRYMQAAHDELVAKEDGPKKRRQPNPRAARAPEILDLKPSFAGAFFVHAILMMVVLIICGMATVLCYHLMMDMMTFPAGRAIAFPVGLVLAAALSYASATYLGVIESTSTGHTDPSTTLDNGWQEWFWTMPTTWGMLGLAGFVAFLVSRIPALPTWETIGIVMWLVYPFIQLSALETGSPLAPFSLPVLKTIGTRPLIWMSFYGLTFVLLLIFAGIGKLTWHDPPYVTMLSMGPITSVLLMIYGWLLGQLARWFSVGGT